MDSAQRRVFTEFVKSAYRDARHHQRMKHWDGVCTDTNEHARLSYNLLERVLTSGTPPSFDEWWWVKLGDEHPNVREAILSQFHADGQYRLFDFNNATRDAEREFAETLPHELSQRTWLNGQHRFVPHHISCIMEVASPTHTQDAIEWAESAFIAYRKTENLLGALRLAEVALGGCFVLHWNEHNIRVVLTQLDLPHPGVRGETNFLRVLKGGQMALRYFRKQWFRE